ncbi:MAG: hypothetical protein WKF47_06310 [Geodermatophilaceae bacterium]
MVRLRGTTTRTEQTITKQHHPHDNAAVRVGSSEALLPFLTGHFAASCALHVGTPASGSAEVDLPGASIQVNLNDQIGSEIFKQRIFDLALSECAWRILAPETTSSTPVRTW